MKPLCYLTLILCLTLAAAQAQGDNQAGVGLFLGVEGRHVVVKNLIPGSPAAAQRSIGVGDRIVSVAQDGNAPVSIDGKQISEVTPLIRGPVGSKVRLTVVPAGKDDSQAKVVSFVRGQVKGVSDLGDGVLLAKGDKAPDIEMVPLPAGQPERLADHAGKIVVLEFWATWCPPCQSKVAELQTYGDKYPDWKGKVVLITASIDDDRETPSQHLQANGWTRTHNVWIINDAKAAYDVDGIPMAYVIDRQGKVIASDPDSIPDVVNAALTAE